MSFELMCQSNGNLSKANGFPQGSPVFTTMYDNITPTSMPSNGKYLELSV